MSAKHPIISVTGSSGAGTTSVRQTFENIFRREHITAAFIEGDAFHRYGRAEMEQATVEARLRGNNNFSHFGEEANLLAELEEVFRSYGESGRGRTRHYIHDENDAELHGAADRHVHRLAGSAARHRLAVLRRAARRRGDAEGKCRRSTPISRSASCR